MEDDTQPPKRKKRETAVQSTSAVQAPPPAQSLQPVNDVVRDALKMFIKSQAEAKKTANKSEIELDALVATMEEFLGSFILIGYDLNNQALPVIIHATNQMQHDALSKALGRFYAHHMSTGGNF